jgi:hypothetical protein
VTRKRKFVVEVEIQPGLLTSDVADDIHQSLLDSEIDVVGKVKSLPEKRPGKAGVVGPSKRMQTLVKEFERAVAMITGCPHCGPDCDLQPRGAGRQDAIYNEYRGRLLKAITELESK